MRAEVKILGDVATMSGSGASDADGDSLSLRLNVGPIHTTAEEIAVENALYMRSPLFTSTLPRGKTWIKLDLSKLETAMGGLLGFAPASFLSALSSPKSVTKIGSSEYHVVPAKGSGSYDVTVGADGYIHHVQSIGSALSLTVDLSDFGRATVAPVPPASKVYTPENGTLPGLGGISA
ncbi:MAG: hypothetical protein JOY73_12345 [Actinobacteria bacterium]|nr:hypothetical protein [Actinomycetota bacterium]